MTFMGVGVGGISASLVASCMVGRRQAFGGLGYGLERQRCVARLPLIFAG